MEPNDQRPEPKPPAPPLFHQVTDDYARLEPGTSDTWNPLHDDVELLHRVELLQMLAWAMREVGPPQSVLDVGCGNGRSTRMYLDLGLRPEQIAGADIRPGALQRARETHPSIRYELYDGGALPWPDGSLDWVSLCTVLSSVRGDEARRHIAGEITRVLQPGGHVFFWDLLRSNDYAGGDALVAEDLFPDCTLAWERATIVRGFRERDFGAEKEAPTHRAALMLRS